MSIEKINLRKLLQYFFSDHKLRRSLLLDDIRKDKAKKLATTTDGGDFYGPFWSDVKRHAAGMIDIVDATEDRIANNKARARLYPLLRDSFLELWSEKMRWRNEPFEFVAETIKAHFPIDELGATIKIENTVSVKVWDGSYRIIYPYFSEDPALPEEGARLGFWALQKALPDFETDDFRIVDIQHRAYFRPNDVRLRGDEEKRFIDRYKALLDERRRLEEER